MEVTDKYNMLRSYIKELESVAVAFSGGVDSVFLLKVCHDVLGDRALAITSSSCLFPKRELEEAKAFCKKEGIKHIVFESNELETEGFRKNPVNRCYLCKKGLFEKILGIAKQNNIRYIAEGSNTDDMGDYRPGLKAVEELGIKSPLRYAGLSKNDIRSLSKKLGLDTWQKPSFACLASRFAYGEEITEEKLAMTDKAEQLLFDMGFKQFRVRIHNKLARIEILTDEFEKIMRPDNRLRIVNELKGFGFTYVSLDLTGYRTGSMNEVLEL